MRSGLLVAVCAAALAAGCGSEHTATTVRPDSAVRTIAADELSAKGALGACADLASPPFAFTRKGRETGFEVELLRRMASLLGTRLVWIPTARADFAASLSAQKCDVIVSRLGYDLDTQFRLDVGALQYLALPLVLELPAGSATAAVGMTDLCGRRLAVVAWTAPAFDAVEQDQACRQEGEPRLRLVEAPSSDAALRLVRSGRAEAVLDDAVSAAAVLAHQPDFDIADVSGRKGYIAIGYRARRLSTEAALHAALLTLYDRGVVRKLVARWHLEDATLLPLP